MGVPWTCRIDYALRLSKAELVALLGEQRIRTALIEHCDEKAGKNHYRNRFLNLASQLRGGGAFDPEYLPDDVEAKEVYSAAVQSCGLHLTTDYTITDPCYVSVHGGMELHDYNSVRGGKVFAWENQKDLEGLLLKQELDDKIKDLGWPVVAKFMIFHDCT
jgi:hypothetical protein